ncbi:MAG: class I SAM-dependent methyltransferase [Methyloligellaceae bacterium]
MSTAEGSAKEHMDQIYRYQRYIYDLSRKFYLLGRDKLIRELDAPAGTSVLEIGCGTGRNLIQAAKKFPDAEFYGVDVSTAMLETAANSLKRTKLTDRVKLSYADATQFDGQETFGIPQYDRVFISYALTMIPPWKEVLDRSLACVAPGGSLHIVDFGQQQKLPRWFRAVLYAWLRQFSVYPQAEMPGEMERVAEKYGAQLKFESLYGGYAEYAILKR